MKSTSERIESVDDPRYVKAMSHPCGYASLRCWRTQASPNQLSGWRREPRDRRVPRPRARAARPDRARHRDPRTRSGRASLPREGTTHGDRRRLGAGAAGRQAGRGRILAGRDRRVLAGVSGRRRLRRADAQLRRVLRAVSTLAASPNSRRRATSCSSRPRRSRRQPQRGSRRTRAPKTSSRPASACCCSRPFGCQGTATAMAGATRAAA